jgi:hypothetical protein
MIVHIPVALRAYRTWTVALVLVVVLAAALAVGLTHGTAPTSVLGEKLTPAASIKADYTLSVSPASRSLPQGTNATFTVTMSVTNGYKGPVALSATVPAGSGLTASFGPPGLDFKNTTSTLTISTSSVATAGGGPWSVTIQGTDGTITHTTSVSVTVSAAPTSPKFTLAAGPASAQVLPGDVAQYGVTVTRNNNYTSPITLLAVGLPAGVSADFGPASPISGSSSTLQVTTASSTPTGTYTLQINASGPNGSGASPQVASVQLVVANKGKPFSISGSLDQLLGIGAVGTPINLVLSNPNNQAIGITNLTVTVVGTSAGNACDASNFDVRQTLSAAYPITLAKSQTASLQQLAVQQSSWPTLRLLDDPTRTQDACKGVSVYLSYSGLGQS